MDNMQRMKELIPLLTEAAKAYYQEDREIMSNFEYDKLYDELAALEAKTGITLAGSPTVSVGYEALEELPKEAHETPMLSLDKTKDIEALRQFMGEHKTLLSWKLDGLTIVLTYRDGKLLKAVTRGNGTVGEVITNNARVFKNIPLQIGYKGELVLRGEAIITYSDFERINAQIEDIDARYKNPRNLCSGSVRQLNNEITAKRNVNFYAFSLVKAEGVDFKNSREQQFLWLKEQGFEVDLVDIDRNGKIDLEHLRELLRRDTILVSVCLVDSELGTIQPVSEIAEILRDYPDCRLHVDATQAMGKIPVCLDGIDTLSFTPHKFYGLNGSGILYKKKDLILEPLIHGGHSTTIYRSGTPALSLAAAAKCALSDAISHQKERYETVSGYNRFLREELSKIPGVSINSPEDAVPHILNVSVKGIRGTRMQQALNEKGICVSVKSACAVEGTPSKAVYAVCRDRNRAMNSFRISLSHLTTKKELDTFLQVFLECCKERE